jgi:DNA replication and repair protein RecF
MEPALHPTRSAELHRCRTGFDGRCNLISGANASGKTSLLEAIFFLGRGRSSARPANETLIRKGSHEL